MSGLGSKVLGLHRAFDAVGITHAIGGAISLGYAIREPRATHDIDINVFVSIEHVDEVLGALPGGVQVRSEDRAALRRDGQVRLWWDETPVDVFLSTVEFHDVAARRIQVVPFEGSTIPVLSPTDLAVFKAAFSRAKDWVDIQAMRDAGSIDVDEALYWIGRMLGADHDNYHRLEEILVSPPSPMSDRDELPPALRPRSRDTGRLWPGTVRCEGENAGGGRCRVRLRPGSTCPAHGWTAPAR